jgi:hypothetical protein
MRIRELEPQLFEPGGSRQHDIRKAPGRLFHEQIVECSGSWRQTA